MGVLHLQLSSGKGVIYRIFIFCHEPKKEGFCYIIFISLFKDDYQIYYLDKTKKKKEHWISEFHLYWGQKKEIKKEKN